MRRSSLKIAAMSLLGMCSRVSTETAQSIEPAGRPVARASAGARYSILHERSRLRLPAHVSGSSAEWTSCLEEC